MAINRKNNNPKEIIKEVEKVIDNSKVLDAYSKSIDLAASGFAEKHARKNELKVINAPGFDFGVRILAYELVKYNIISCEKMFDFLKKNCYNGYNTNIGAWWIDKK